MQPTRTTLCSAACAWLLASCAGVPLPQAPATGEASWRAVEAPDVGHYVLSPGQVSSGAAAMAHQNPEYPASELARCPAVVEITALLIVDPAGKVSAVRVPAESGEDAAGMAPFVAAARAAALQWQFQPLVFSEWITDAAGNDRVAGKAAQPFSLAYVFRFVCHAGKGAGSATANPSTLR